MAMNDKCLLELEIEEQLFAAVVHCPFEECEKLVLKLPDIDVKNASGRSLLHVAVRLGKLDWIEGLMRCGADASLMDNNGFTVLEVAMDIVDRSSKDGDLKMLLRFARVVSEFGLKARKNVVASAGKSSAMISKLKADENIKEGTQDLGLSEVLSSILRMSQEISSLKGSLDQLRSDTATQIGDLRQHVLGQHQIVHRLLSSSEEIPSIKENVQSLTKSMSSLKGTSQTARGDTVKLVNELSQHMISSGIEISSVKQSVNSISADAYFMRESLDKLQSNITSLAGEVTSMRSVLGEVERDVHSVVTRRESDSSGQLNSLKKAVEEVGRNLRARDTLLEALETSVTSMAERMALAAEENKRATTELQDASKAVEENKKKVKRNSDRVGPTTSDSVASGLQTTVSSLAELRPKNETLNRMSMSQGAAECVVKIEEDDEELDSDDEEYETYDEEYETGDEEDEFHDEVLIGTASGFDYHIIQTSEEEDCMRCVEAMMEKTYLYNNYHGEASKVRNFYRVLYITSPVTSSILTFLSCHPIVRVSIDLGSSKIANMKENFVDHDGVYYHGGAFINSAADFAEKRVYLGGLVERCEMSMLAHFMKSLTQMALFLAFDNMGRPYFRYDHDMKNAVREIYDEAHWKKFDQRIHLDWYLHKALVARDGNGAEMLLIPAVPAIMVKYDSMQGTALLREQLPALLSFYTERLMPLIYRATRKLQLGR